MGLYFGAQEPPKRRPRGSQEAPRRLPRQVKRLPRATHWARILVSGSCRRVGLVCGMKLWLHFGGLEYHFSFPELCFVFNLARNLVSGSYRPPARPELSDANNSKQGQSPPQFADAGKSKQGQSLQRNSCDRLPTTLQGFAKRCVAFRCTPDRFNGYAVIPPTP